MEKSKQARIKSLSALCGAAIISLFAYSHSQPNISGKEIDTKPDSTLNVSVVNTVRDNLLSKIDSTLQNVPMSNYRTCRYSEEVLELYKLTDSLFHCINQNITINELTKDISPYTTWATTNHIEGKVTKDTNYYDVKSNNLQEFLINLFPDKKLGFFDYIMGRDHISNFTDAAALQALNVITNNFLKHNGRILTKEDFGISSNQIDLSNSGYKPAIKQILKRQYEEIRNMRF
jgi:hypothetical protein